MNNDITALKKAWRLMETEPDKDLREFHQVLLLWRKRKKRAIFSWSFSVILFTGIAVAYVIYTDELNSIYKSVSEIILLFVSIYLFGYSWKSINEERKEYLSNSIDFIKTLPGIQLERYYRTLMVYCTCTTVFLVAIVLYLFDSLLTYRAGLIAGLSVLIILIAILWAGIKPSLWKREKMKNRDLSDKIIKMLNND